MNKNLLRKIESLVPPPARLINQYKRRDVFRCTHETHQHFNSAVSVHHVLKVKGCYPRGCIYFQWRCRKLNKGAACPRKFKHVGRACASCPDFYDVKVIRRPEIIIPSGEFERFQNDLKAFETWLREHGGRQVACSGVVNSIKPRYSLRLRAKKTSVVFEGYILNFREAFINNSRFHDFIYVPLSLAQQQRFCFAKGDTLSFTGRFTEREGLIVLEHIRGVEIQERGEPCFWTESRARVAQRSGTILPYQASKCHACDRGILLEVVAEEGRKGARRKMFCLEGVEDPQWCWYAVQRVLRLDECSGGGSAP